MLISPSTNLPLTSVICWETATFGITTTWFVLVMSVSLVHSCLTPSAQVTRGMDYISTLKMYSSRTRNAECTNSQNPFGFHLADGTTYTYVTGDEYEDIAAAWDWNMIPGTTLNYGATPLSCDTENQAGVENFVGGTSTGKIGAAVMVCSWTGSLRVGCNLRKTLLAFSDTATR